MDVDWRKLVVSYPKTSLTVAAVGGYLLGRANGAAMVAALGSFATESVSRGVNELIGDDVL